MIGMLTVPMMMLPGLVGLPGRGSIGYLYSSSSLPATNMASLPDDESLRLATCNLGSNLDRRTEKSRCSVEKGFYVVIRREAKVLV